MAKKKVQSKKKKPMKRKYKVLKKLEMEEIFRMLNKVQISGKKATFSVETGNAQIVENVIKDAELPYERKLLKTKTTFIVLPPEPKDEDEELDFHLDFLEDEITQDGKLF